MIMTIISTLTVAVMTITKITITLVAMKTLRQK